MKASYNKEHGYMVVIATESELNRFHFMLGAQVRYMSGVVATLDCEYFGRCVFCLKEVVGDLTVNEFEAMLAHEEGHIVLGHRRTENSTAEEVEAMELAADAYAISKGHNPKHLISAGTKIIQMYAEYLYGMVPSMVPYKLTELLTMKEWRDRVNQAHGY